MRCRKAAFRSGYLNKIDGKRELYKGKLLATQLCYSNKNVREKIAEAAVKYASEHPEVTLLRFALSDGVNNHCECENCRKMRPSDWLIMILNEINEKLTAAGLDTQVSFPVYTDCTWEPCEVKLKNPSRFLLNLSPSSRAYTKPLYDFDKDPDSIELPPYERNNLTMPSDVETIVAFYKRWRKWTGCECIIFEYALFWDHYLDAGYYDYAKLVHKDVTGLDKLGFVGYTSCQQQRCAFPTALPMYDMAGYDAKRKACTEYHFANQRELHTVLDSFFFERVYSGWINNLYKDEIQTELNF